MGRDALIWTAGLIDGEGGMYVWGNKVTIQVEMTHPGPPRRLYALFGGSLEGPVFRKNARPNTRPSWRWRLYGDDARDLARRLADLKLGGEPALLVKREEAIAVAESLLYPKHTEYGRAMRERARRHRWAAHHGEQA